MSQGLISSEDASFSFIIDQVIRSFDCRETLYRLPPRELETIVLKSLKTHDGEILKLAYHRIKNSIEKHVRLQTPQSIEAVSHVEFHAKFGWIISNGSEQAYLGKTDDISSIMSIGTQSYFNGKSHIRGNGKLSVGMYCSIADGVEILTSNISHPTQFASTYNLGGNQRIKAYGKPLTESFYRYANFKNDCHIGHDVWIGEDVSIMNGVSIGHGCVIGKGALVTKDCDAYGVYVGFPAKKIKYRFHESIIDFLQALKWWNWSKERIQANEKFFLTDFNHINLNQLQALLNL